ncbi:hypothetical protein F5Y19DRAFT_371189 [Xylariaceae sp. FL1651]|nr:hypothetical protein F5Y19DRAFT_371189 [Xylariaceae sp. FL1651]
MAASSTASQRPGLADMQRRAAEDPAVAYKAFDSYPWQKDKMFNIKLVGALYAVEPEGSHLAEVALRMRIDRFANQIGIQIDKDAYKQWLAETGSLQPKLFSEEDMKQEAKGRVLPAERRFALLHAEYGYLPDPADPESIDSSVPSWQRGAPKAELYVPKNAGSLSPEKEPYPKNFEQIVRHLETGQEIPGIRQIPDTVVDDPSISTHGRMPVPLKPWERRGGGTNTSTGQGMVSD